MTVSSPIRVVIMSNSLNAGGAERFASHLLRWLGNAGVEVRLALLRRDIGYPLAREVPIHVLGYRGFRDLPRTIWRLRCCIDRVQPSLVLGAGTSVNLVIGMALASMHRRPAWIAPMDTNLERKDLRLRRMVLKPVLRRADCVVAISRRMRDQLQTLLPPMASKLDLLRNPVDFEHISRQARQHPSWRKPAGAPLIISVGRAHRVKRWDVLLKAFAKVVAARPAVLALCGDGPRLNELKDLARSLKIDRRVYFLGHCANPFAILAQADIFVLSSEAEGLPYALIEAQALGLCAVATRCDFGPDEIVFHGKTGLLTPGNDSDAMAGAIMTLLADDGLRRRMGRAASEKVRRQFDFQDRCRDWEALIRRVDAEHAGKSVGRNGR